MSPMSRGVTWLSVLLKIQIFVFFSELDLIFNARRKAKKLFFEK